jgi:hypothetical protein
MAHTPGLLAYDGKGRVDAVDFRTPTGHICADGTEYIDGLVSLPYSCGDGSFEDNARRIVACWNACDGIATEDLESGSDTATAYWQRIVKERDGLSATLKRLERAVDLHLGRSSWTQTTHLKGAAHGTAVRAELFAAHDAARAAIAGLKE